MATTLPDTRRANVRMLLSLYLGWAGADRFYEGQIALGILKAVTGGGFLVWWLVDSLYYSYQAGKAEPNRGYRYQNILLGLGLVYGFLGVDRMYNGQVELGILKLITGGGFGIWWLIDNLSWAGRAGKAEPGRGWWWRHIRLVLSIVYGFLGVDRAYNGQVGWAVLKLFTFGGLGVWWIADAAYYSYLAGRE
ncbi:MAG: TM2 domain-containing protein [Dehalococcoidia bacterium]|nr:TM2 domain-containing protein [Dehalococcoidia bacterium]